MLRYLTKGDILVICCISEQLIHFYHLPLIREELKDRSMRLMPTFEPYTVRLRAIFSNAPTIPFHLLKEFLISEE